VHRSLMAILNVSSSVAGSFFQLNLSVETTAPALGEDSVGGLGCASNAPMVAGRGAVAVAIPGSQVAALVGAQTVRRTPIIPAARGSGIDGLACLS